MNYDIFPIILVITIIFALGLTIILSVSPAYADYIEYLPFPLQGPTVCIFEAEEENINFWGRGLLEVTLDAIQVWPDRLNDYTNSTDYNLEYKFIANETHYADKIADYPYCDVAVLYDYENPRDEDIIGLNAIGFTAFSFNSSAHKLSIITIFTDYQPNRIILNANNISSNNTDIIVFNIQTEPAPQASAIIFKIITHEFGHALGLGHHQTTLTHNFNSTMFSSFNTDKPELASPITDYDMAAVVNLYGWHGFKTIDTDLIPAKYGT